ncbi:PRC-barrel domain-containing protein [Dietzia sp. 179-F 9C3 NHS]|uniref:PRC-barrel domain-containing protein n=1 Tax=Dietzia sp. 179-F 9C3 NHS TaxID=3374295 RepID=UPI00387A395C
MTLKDQLDSLLAATAFDSAGTKIGAVRQVYVDDGTGKITFATVSTGIFSSDAIVPLHGARLLDGELHVDHTRSAVRDSPRPDHTEDGLTPDQEIELLEHYGVEIPPRSRDAAEPGADAGAGRGPGAGRGTGPQDACGATRPAKGDAAQEEKGATTTRATDTDPGPTPKPADEPNGKKTDKAVTAAAPKPEKGDRAAAPKPTTGPKPDVKPAPGAERPEESPDRA